MQAPIYVISLARAPERRKSVKEHLDKIGLIHQIIDAVNENLLAEDEIKTLLTPEKQYAAGVVGCYLSHIRIYETIIFNKHSVALVL